MIGRAYLAAAYYVTLVLFGVFGLTLSALGLLTAWLPKTRAVNRRFQRLVHHHFRLFLWWGRVSGTMDIQFAGFPGELSGGRVVVANHPSLIDITCLLARIPEALCIFKPAIRRNPILGAAARRAGYLANDGGPDLVRSAAEALAAGETLVVFPEGTRTAPSVPLLPLKPGFVLMARRGGVPIQLVRIETNSNVLTKSIAWWKPPQLPARVRLTWGPAIVAENDLSPAELAARIAAWFEAKPPACHEALAGLTWRDSAAPAS